MPALITDTAKLQQASDASLLFAAAIDNAIDDLETKLAKLRDLKRLNLDCFREIPANESVVRQLTRRAGEAS